MIKLIIAATLFAGSLAATEIGYAELLILFLRVVVRAEEHRPEEASVDGALI
jgi:hypothetical protein